MSETRANQPLPIMGIDLGEVRVGVAVSDALGMFAHARETIRRQADKGKAADKPVIARIVELARKENVGSVVLGLPRNMDGSEGPAAGKARAFAEMLRAAVGCEVYLLDERLTTVAAQKALHASGRNTKQSRIVIDQVAAQIILQSHLDALALKREAGLLSDGF